MKLSLSVSRFGGLDERRVFSDSFATACDMRNYRITENRTLKKRPGITRFLTAPGEVTGLWSGYLGEERCFLYVAGGVLYRISEDNGLPMRIGEVGEGRCLLFEFCQRIYIKSDTAYSFCDGMSLFPVEGYVPLIATGCSPSGAGEAFEQINLLSRKRRVRFSGDGTSLVYHLPEKDLLSVTVSLPEGGELPAYTADLANGTVTFQSAPPQGSNRILMEYEVREDRSRVILDCTQVMLFGGSTDGHVFLWGNPEHPGTRFHSELANGQPSAEYFPENNYTVIGNSAITDIISQYDRQLIFTKDRAFYSYCELQTDTRGNVKASFPVYNLNGEKGSLLPGMGCIMNNEPVTLCVDGLNRWCSTAVENEKNAVCFSDAVGKSMASAIASGRFGQMRLFNRRSAGELYFVCGQLALVYQYRLGVWYAYDNFEAELFAEYDGKLFFTRGDTILFLDEDNRHDEQGQIINAYWETPYVYLSQGFGNKATPERVSFLARASGPLEWEIASVGSVSDPTSLLQRTKIVRSCSLDEVIDGSFRTRRFASPFIKFRLTQQDHAFCELCSLQLLTRQKQKGRYDRKGIQSTGYGADRAGKGGAE